MIFLTVGTQLPFDRLVRAVDDWAAMRPGVRIVAQIGREAWRPEHLEWSEELGPAEFEVMLRAADLVVAHAGMGTVLRCRDLGKPLVVVPRVAALGEHRNDHQLATARRLVELGLATVARNEIDLRDLLSTRASLAPASRTGGLALDEFRRNLAHYVNA